MGFVICKVWDLLIVLSPGLQITNLILSINVKRVVLWIILLICIRLIILALNYADWSESKFLDRDFIDQSEGAFKKDFLYLTAYWLENKFPGSREMTRASGHKILSRRNHGAFHISIFLISGRVIVDVCRGGGAIGGNIFIYSSSKTMKTIDYKIN